jgi:hypothetical protein
VFDDGRYCAVIEYRNENSGNVIEDVLPVEVQNDALIKINWTDVNDGPYFDAIRIIDSVARFTSGNGSGFKVTILGAGEDCSVFPGTAKYHKQQICPVCGHRKNAADELCKECNDEIANTCYRCGTYSFNLNGTLCEDCRKSVCPICNGRKDLYDDLCAECHNLIEEQTSGNAGTLQ